MREKTYRLYQFHGYQLDVDGGTLKKGDEPVQITPKAFETLVVLLKNRGRVVEKEVIFDEVWTDTFVEEGTLAQNISTLRKALGTLENGKQFIETVPRRGYKLVADVREIITNEETIVVERSVRTDISADFRIHESADSDASSKVIDLSETNSGRKFNFYLFLKKNSRAILAGLFVIAVVSTLIFTLISYRSGEIAGVSAALPVSSIAVLPFQNVGEQDQKEKFGFGLADAIITRLSKLQKIPVRPTSAVYRFSEQPPASVIAAGQELNVDAVLAGTVQRDGDRVRVTVQLTNVADGKPLWAETIDEKSADVFTLQDSISSKVVHLLAFKLTPEQEKLLSQRPTDNVEAFEAYQMGVYLWNTRTRENLVKAKSYFEKAVELDPGFARAYAMLADTDHLIGYYIYSNDPKYYEEARINAQKALALDDSVAEAYLAMAAVQVNAGNLEMAIRYLENAVQRSPYNSTIRVRYSWNLLRTGKIDQAVSEMKLAVEYDPLSPVSNGALCNMLNYRENFAEAVTVCRKAVELSPETADNRLSLADAYFFKGETDEAIKLAKTDAERPEKKYSALGSLGFYYAKSGNRTEAEKIVAQLKSESEKDSGIDGSLAIILYALGKKDEAYDHFKKAYDKKTILTLLFNNDPVWKEIRQDPQFMKLMEEP